MVLISLVNCLFVRTSVRLIVSLGDDVYDGLTSVPTGPTLVAVTTNQAEFTSLTDDNGM